VNFGGYQYTQFFDPTASNCSGPLPGTPRPAGDACRCPHCASQGFYADSPLCRFCAQTRCVAQRP
jgi:hypothetical protein